MLEKADRVFLIYDGVDGGTSDLLEIVKQDSELYYNNLELIDSMSIVEGEYKICS